MNETSTADRRAAVVALLDRVAGLLDDLDDPQWWRCSDEETFGAVESAYRCSTRLHVLGVTGVAEVADRGLATAAGATSTQAWLRHRVGIRPGEAKRDRELARLLSRRSWAAGEDVEGTALGRALAAGEVNIGQAGAIVTALAELPRDTDIDVRVRIERLMVDRAEVADPAELTRYGHVVLEEVDPDAADEELGRRLEREEREAARQRGATRHADGHGSVFYRFRVSVADDAHVWPVLDTLATPRPGTGGVQDDRTSRQRMADALVEAMQRVSLDGGLPAKGGDRPRALVTVGLAELRAGVGAGSLVDTGEHLSISALRQLACDAQVIPAVLDGPGRIIELGRAQRTFVGPARTAVVARDGGCVHPGCDRPPRWCDVHHVVPWWAGGETRPGNGVLLCGFHHRLYDNGSWSIEFAEDGYPEAVPPPWVDTRQRPVRHTRFLTRRRPRAA